MLVSAGCIGFPAALLPSTAAILGVAFEDQAELLTARMAGAEIALDARDVLDEIRPDLAVVDCMLPAAIAAARATGTPTVSLVHFLYGLARTQMLRARAAGRRIFAASPRPIGCSGSLPPATG